jgi:hypothetical protein
MTDGSMADDESFSDGNDKEMTVSTKSPDSGPTERQLHSRRLLPTLSMQQRSIRRRRPISGGIEIPKVASVRERMKNFESR